MAKNRWLGSSVLLLVTALTILCLCVWQTYQLGAQKSLTTDFALTLTRLAQWRADSAASEGFTADGAAQLVAVGDVQSEAIGRALSEVPIGRFKDSGNKLVSYWQQVRRAFSDINTAPSVAPPQPAVAVGNINGLAAALQAYDSLFNAIVSESLSKPLLSQAGDIRGQLLALDILLEAGLYTDQTRSVIDALKQRSAQMQATVRPTDGPAILGYQSSRKLDTYLDAVAAISINETVVSNSAPATSPPSLGTLSEVTADALQFTRALLQAIETEQQDSRRNVLLALLLFSLCVLLTAGISWSLRRSGAASTENHRHLIHALKHDLAQLAAGDFSHHSTVTGNSAPDIAMANAFNAATHALNQRQQRLIDMLSQSSSLAVQQQEIVESLEARLADLSARNQRQAAEVEAAFDEVDELLRLFVGQGDAQQSEVRWQLADAVADTAASLARVTAQLDLSTGRVTRAVERVQNLQATVGQIERHSRHSNLQALNESIKLSGYYDSADESDRFIEKTQQLSHMLQIAAEGALTTADEIHADLQACSEALKQCLTAAQESAQNALRSNRMLKAGGEENSLEPQVRQLEKVMQALNESFNQQYSSDNKSTEEELLYIKGHALELQLLAAEVSQSIKEPESQVDEQ
ncbi:MAG: hypothetical protein AAF404_00105 [Pseudomonadota bacterium]